MCPKPLIAAGTAPARLLTHARILLKADRGPSGPGWVDVRIADAVEVTERRTRTDWAWQIKDLVDRRYPAAERIVLVMDNLNAHSPASLYEAFPPAEAKRRADKLEFTTRPSAAVGSTWQRSS